MSGTCTLDARKTRRPSEDHLARLVARAASGDERAWSELVRELGGFVRCVIGAYRLGADDAADVYQHTWMRLAQNLDRIYDPARVKGWLATTARRRSLEVIGRAGRDLPLGEAVSEWPCPTPAHDDRLIHTEQAVAMRSALARLHPRDRALLVMLTADPRPSYDEIGATLGMPVGSIGPTRARALAKLKREAVQTGLFSEPSDRLAA